MTFLDKATLTLTTIDILFSVFLLKEKEQLEFLLLNYLLLSKPSSILSIS